MISLYEGQITDIMPLNYAQDPEIIALSYAIQYGMQLLLDHARRAVIYADIDSADEAELDLLAVENRVQYYDMDYDVEVKRDLVKKALRWHQIAGTTGSVEELAKSIFGACDVQEWYQYSGNPFCFRVITSALADPNNIVLFNRLLKNVKPLRATLESVSILRTISTQGSHSVSVRVQVSALPAIHCAQI